MFDFCEKYLVLHNQTETKERKENSIKYLAGLMISLPIDKILKQVQDDKNFGSLPPKENPQFRRTTNEKMSSLMFYVIPNLFRDLTNWK